MKVRLDAHLRRDLLKIACVACVLAGVAALFVVTPALSTPTFLSIIMTMLLSPPVAALERRGYPRWLSIMVIFATHGTGAVLANQQALQAGQVEWEAFREQAPVYFQATIDRLRALEHQAQARFPFLTSVHPTDSVVSWVSESGRWFVDHGAGIVGEILTCLFIAPILTFVMINDGRAIRRRLFHLVPNRWFETVFHVTSEILTSLSDYLGAKLLEALLVGLMVGAGLWIAQAPYAIVLGIVAGVTNIVPYLGPVLGAIPALLIVGLDSQLSHLFWPVLLVFVIANVIDMVVIFPVIVAKLVDLHPLILIAVVAVGQQYSGLVGMLVSIPVASALKVVLQQIYVAVYESRVERREAAGARADAALLRVE